MDIGGSASDNVGVTQVTWTNAATGASGVAIGTTSWSVVGVALAAGNNIITLRVRDAAGNTGVDTITVGYDPSAPVCSITTPTSSPTYSTTVASGARRRTTSLWRR
jgi:predicted secreted hydrolase